MSRSTLRPRTSICQLCEFILPRQSSVRQQQCRLQKAFHHVRPFTTIRTNQTKILRASNQSSQAASQTVRYKTGGGKRKTSKDLTEAELESRWQEVKADCNNLLLSEKPPPEQATERALMKCNWLAELLVFDHSFPSAEEKSGATSALLSLDLGSVKKTSTPKDHTSDQRMINDLSRLAFSVAKHPPIFISPKVLEIYTKIQANLGRPETLPAVFQMYANKPLPQQTFPIRYSKQNPNKVANAVPATAANRALQAAIDAKQLAVAMDIIESTYTTKAFHRAKFVRKCLVPATGVALAPVAAYSIASKLALLQTTMDADMATHVAFAGILAYTIFTGTIGIVAITTANDQMDRVTWAPGIPLRERWIREEERAAIDKTAGSWGFRESWRRGEEEGEDWEALREWIGSKGMILDRVELMEGME